MSTSVTQPSEQYLSFCSLVDSANTDKELEAQHEAAIACLENLDACPQTPWFEPHLIEYLCRPDSNPDKVEKLTALYLKEKYHFQDPDYPVTLEQLSTDTLLISALSRLKLKDTELESFVCELRSSVLSVLASQAPTVPVIQLATALALHGNETSYSSAAPEPELTLVASLGQTLDAHIAETEGKVPVDHVCSLLLAIGMYQSFAKLKCVPALSQVEQEQWPAVMQPLVKGLMVPDASPT